MVNLNDKSDPTSSVQAAEVPWSEAIVMICTKCARKLGDESAADALKGALKAKSKSEGDGVKFRFVTSSCLNICPEGRMAIAIAKADACPTFRALTIQPGLSADELYKLVRPS